MYKDKQTVDTPKKKKTSEKNKKDEKDKLY